MQRRRIFQAIALTLCGATSLLIVPTGLALTQNPYEGIVARNVFSLKPAPPPPSVEPPKPPASKIILTGITTILGMKQALMKTAATAGKPGEAKGEQSYILTEGQREGDIEVIEIDEKAGTVKVTQDGTVFVLNFDKDGQKPSGGAPGGPPAAIPPPTGFGSPAGIPAPQPGAMPKFNMPTRPLRAGPGAAANSGGFGSTANTGGFGSPVPDPGLSLGANGMAGSAAGDAASLQAAAQRSAEENVALYEANRIKNQELIQAGARLPPMPQHIYLGGGQQSQVPQAAPQAPSLPFAPGIQQVPAAQ